MNRFFSVFSHSKAEFANELLRRQSRIINTTSEKRDVFHPFNARSLTMRITYFYFFTYETWNAATLTSHTHQGYAMKFSAAVEKLIMETRPRFLNRKISTSSRQASKGSLNAHTLYEKKFGKEKVHLSCRIQRHGIYRTTPSSSSR